MGPLSYTRSVVDRDVVMRRIAAYEFRLAHNSTRAASSECNNYVTRGVSVQYTRQRSTVVCRKNIRCQLHADPHIVCWPPLKLEHTWQGNYYLTSL